jgi:hypothetical protein
MWISVPKVSVIDAQSLGDGPHDPGIDPRNVGFDPLREDIASQRNAAVSAADLRRRDDTRGTAVLAAR